MKKRKTRRQLLAKKEAIAKSLVDKANSVPNPLEPLSFFHKYVTKDNETIELSCMRSKDAQAECVSWIFDIMERNMKSMYEQSDWGWDPVAKQNELTEPEAWYLVASSNEKFIGFSHFRFDIDHKEEVLYCYKMDKTSPTASDQVDYIILSKIVDNGTMSRKLNSSR